MLLLLSGTMARRFSECAQRNARHLHSIRSNEAKTVFMVTADYKVPNIMLSGKVSRYALGSLILEGSQGHQLVKPQNVAGS